MKANSLQYLSSECDIVIRLHGQNDSYVTRCGRIKSRSSIINPLHSADRRVHASPRHARRPQLIGAGEDDRRRAGSVIAAGGRAT